MLKMTSIGITLLLILIRVCCAFIEISCLNWATIYAIFIILHIYILSTYIIIISITLEIKNFL